MGRDSGKCLHQLDVLWVCGQPHIPVVVTEAASDLNIGLQFLARGLSISHEIWWISGEIHWISDEIHPEPYKFRCFSKNSSVWGGAWRGL